MVNKLLPENPAFLPVWHDVCSFRGTKEERVKMFKITPFNVAFVILSMMMISIILGMRNNDVLAFNEMLYQLGLWEWVS